MSVHPTRLGIVMLFLALAASACRPSFPVEPLEPGEVEQEDLGTRDTLSPDASLAVAEPCRYMGTVHRRGRHQLEVLRTRKHIDHAQWSCAARELAEVDRRFTAACVDEPVEFEAIQAELRQRYEACFGPRHADEVDFATDFSRYL